MKEKSEAGFSYIDVMIAVVILLVGILALLSAITGAVFMTRAQSQQMNAKQIATSTIESIMSVKETARETDVNKRVGWTRIGNTDCSPTGGPAIFATGFRQVTDSAGPDEVMGTCDDNGNDVAGFRRQIVIRDECDVERPSPNCVIPGTFDVRVRSIEITVTYFVGTIQRQEMITTVLTDYANNN